MKTILSRIKSLLPTGLAGKLIRAVVIIFLLVGLVSFGVTHLEVGELEKLVRNEGEDLTSQTRRMTSSGSMHMNSGSFLPWFRTSLPILRIIIPYL